MLFVLTMVFFWIEYSVGRFTLNSSNIGAQQCTSRRLNSIFCVIECVTSSSSSSYVWLFRSSVLAAHNSFVRMYVCMYMSGSIRAIIV